jgi:hypothetical protein
MLEERIMNMLNGITDEQLIAALANIDQLRSLRRFTEYGTSHYVLISPELAKSILENNNWNNRPFITAKVKQFKEIIQSGNWGIHSQGIAFTHDGRLLNGQHRLAGIFASKKPCILAVVFNERDESYRYMDTGTRRSLSDTAGIPKQSAQLVKFFNYLCYGATVVQPLPALNMADSLEAAISVKNSISTNGQNVPVRAAFVSSWILKPNDREYACLSFLALCKPTEVIEIPDVHLTYMRNKQHNRGIIKRGGSVQVSEYYNALNLFDPSRKNIRMFRKNDACEAFHKSGMKNHFESWGIVT